jgi:hypothetical protein
MAARLVYAAAIAVALCALQGCGGGGAAAPVSVAFSNSAPPSRGTVTVNGQEYAAGYVVVGFGYPSTAPMDTIRQRASALVTKYNLGRTIYTSAEFTKTNVYLYTDPLRRDPAALVQELKTDPTVAYAELDALFHSDGQ